MKMVGVVGSDLRLVDGSPVDRSVLACGVYSAIWSGDEVRFVDADTTYVLTTSIAVRGYNVPADVIVESDGIYVKARPAFGSASATCTLLF